MFCPNCGKKNALQQQFCRFSGLALEQIAQSLAEQGPVKVDQRLREQKERLEQWGFITLCVCGGGILFAILYKIVSLLVAGKFLAGLGALGVVVIVGCGLLAAILFEEAKKIETDKNKGRLQELQQAEEEQTTTQRLPEGYAEELPSVAKRTTELLYAEKRGHRQ